MSSGNFGEFLLRYTSSTPVALLTSTARPKRAHLGWAKLSISSQLGGSEQGHITALTFQCPQEWSSKSKQASLEFCYSFSQYQAPLFQSPLMPFPFLTFTLLLPLC